MRRTPSLLGAALIALATLATPAALADTGSSADPSTPSATAPTASDVPPEDVLTWSIAPAVRAETGEGERVSVRTTIDPGGVYADAVVVTNFSEQDVEFTLVASDGVIGEDGAFDILSGSEEPTDGGSWIGIAETVRVPALESATVPFTIEVPADATPGDHPAGITAGVVQTTEAAEGTSVGFEARVGVRIHLRVAGELTPSIEVTDLTTRYEASVNPFMPGAIVATYTVRNTGNTRIGAQETLTSAGLFGVATGTASVSAEQAEILPGDQVAVEARQEGVWPLGQIRSDLTATPLVVGEDDLTGTTLAVATASASALAVPWSQVAIVALAVGLLLLVRTARRRRRAAYAAALQRAREEGAAAAATTAGAGARSE
ncbi:hypothetical protein [Miniimonas arenae]|uniref:hypothetical protein n=1 Tax=Miniimonas arenae TaxID=676201 RepID=UPI0028A656AE|nr:hypothetical protein [Miniimonas arenae]